MPTGVYQRKKEDIEKLLKNSGNPKGNKMSDITKAKISESHKRTGSPWNVGNSWNKGKKISDSIKRKISESLRGDKSYRWKGGISKTSAKERNTMQYRNWRKAVLERDSYSCTWCGSKEKIQADHIKPFALYVELRFLLDNGRTLCLDCHKKTPTFAGRTKRK